jgi:hypothetical protein
MLILALLRIEISGCTLASRNISLVLDKLTNPDGWYGPGMLAKVIKIELFCVSPEMKPLE